MRYLWYRAQHRLLTELFTGAPPVVSGLRKRNARQIGRTLAGVFLAVLSVSFSTHNRAAAATLAEPAASVIISGNVTDARKLPIIGAVITARGSAVGWTATVANGFFIMHVMPGSYEILVRKGSYTPQAVQIAVNAGSPRTLAIELREANLGSLSVGSSNSGAESALNTQVSAAATLAQDAITERPQVALPALALELPGITLAHPAASEPNTSFVVRGGTIETRVQIDGHAVSAGATGRWDSSYASLPLFDSIEVAKGTSVSGANAGESAFGTVNLRTREFTRGQQADLLTGVDNFGGSYTTVGLSGTTMTHGRLSYIVQHSVSGYNGPDMGKIVNNIVPESGNAALLVSKMALDAPFTLGSDLAKLRWRFNGNTSLTVGYIGIHGEYAQTGGAFGTYLGNRTIVPSAPYVSTAAPINQYSSPQFPGAIGTTIPGYSLAHNTSVQTNQPLFEAELRTAIRNDTLLIRPYVGTIFHLFDGSGRTSGPDSSDGGAWAALTTGAGCSPKQPCLVPNSALSGFRDEELDRLHGTTVTLLHPVGDGALNLSYDYRSDETTVTSGDPKIAFNGTLSSIAGYLTSIPTTLARSFDWSATYTVPISTRLTLSLGDYYTNWKLHYGSILSIPNFVTGQAVRIVGWGDRSAQHDDPHFGLSWRPGNDTTYRFTAGSAVTVPYADLVAGGPTTTGPFTSTGFIAEKNPDLQPESTVAYNLGMDHRFRDGTIGTLDVFDNTIHNVFATRVIPFSGAVFGIPPGSPYNALFATITKPLNAPIEPNYGVEIALTKRPTVGIGYHLAATLQRAYLQGLPASFFSAQSSLINGKQLDGSTSIPYTHAYGELTFRQRSGIAGALGADYTGSNNWTNGPAFLVWSSMLRYDIRGGYRAQFSVENIFNTNTGNAYAAGSADGGFRSVNYGSSVPGALPTFGATATTRFAIAPRTYRFQLGIHVGH